MGTTMCKEKRQGVKRLCVVFVMWGGGGPFLAGSPGLDKAANNGAVFFDTSRPTHNFTSRFYAAVSNKRIQSNSLQSKANIPSSYSVTASPPHCSVRPSARGRKKVPQRFPQPGMSSHHSAGKRRHVRSAAHTCLHHLHYTHVSSPFLPGCRRKPRVRPSS